MTTRRVLLIGDVHLSDKPPSSCTESYTDDLFDLLYQTVQLAKVRNYDAVIQAGDLFHLKSPIRTSHRLVQRTIDLIKLYPCPFFIVPGNHDMSNDVLDTVMDSQPLGVVLRSGAHQLRGWAGQVVGDLNIPVYGVPWIQQWNDREKDGAPTTEALKVVQTSLADWNDRWGDRSHPALLVTHAPFYPPGFELEFENFPTPLFAELLGNSGDVYYGHIHEQHGVYETNGARFCNNGALSRGSLHEYNRSRDIVVTEWSWDEELKTRKFSTIKLNHKPSHEIFRSEALEKVCSSGQPLDLDQFLDSIGQTTIEVTNIESVMQHIRSLQLGPKTETLISELLEAATHD